MPHFNAFDALAIVPGNIGEDRTVTAMKAGAHDSRLPSIVEKFLKGKGNKVAKCNAGDNRKRHYAAESKGHDNCLLSK